MITQYVERALGYAHYEMIEDDEPYYGEVPGLKGVWATGTTLEECRHELADAIEDWLLFSIAKGLPIPSMGDISIRVPEKLVS